VRAALLEDLGRAGDITTDAIAPSGLMTTTAMVARQDGVVAGLDLAALAFRLIDPAIVLAEKSPTGARRGRRDDRAGRRPGARRSDRRAHRAEFPRPPQRRRVGDGFVGRRGGGDQARIVCTRKTTPLLRAIEKYAVRVGGGGNHRFGLDDAALIKDNHIAIAGGVAEAIRRVRACVGHLVKIEVEVDTLAHLEEALEVGVDAALLDNMSLEDLRRAVAMIAGRAISEASGRVTKESAPAIAATGVDLISVGWLTHSAPILDIGLDHQG